MPKFSKKETYNLVESPFLHQPVISWVMESFWDAYSSYGNLWLVAMVTRIRKCDAAVSPQLNNLGHVVILVFKDKYLTK